MDTKVINLLGPPSAGKSTVALGLGYELKKLGTKIEVVPEYAKGLVWLDRFNELQKNQVYVFAKQYQHLWRVYGKVDYIITDTSLILSTIYGNATEFKNFIPLVLEIYNSMNNINYFIDPNPDIPYEEVGRYQDKEQSEKIGLQIKNTLNEYNIPYKHLVNNDTIVKTILDQIY